MKQDENPNEDDLTLVFCSRCGTPLGRLGEGARYGVLCSRCKKEYVVTLQEDTVVQVPSGRRRKAVPT